MDQATKISNTAALIVAAGKGIRAGQPLPKQFTVWRGKPVLRHSVDAFLKAGITQIAVVIPENGEQLAAAALKGTHDVVLIVGGATRQDSVRAGLECLSASNPDSVMIHDAARPMIPQSVLQRLTNGLAMSQGAIPVLPVVDSISIDEDGIMAGSANRAHLRRVQTPQAFKFADILAAHRAWDGPTDAGDDAQIMVVAGGTVSHIDGDDALKKLTFAEDFVTNSPSFRTGSGFDVHRLVNGEELWLGGIKIEHHQGLSGHSDADVALHAIVDALLGAVAAGDIGDHFPPSDDRWKGARSSEFVTHAVSLVEQAGYTIGNIDLTLMCEAPKIGPHRDAMRERIAGLLGVDIGQVSVKATTTERLGFTGRGEGIAAQATATVFTQG